jgi:hypothetical protein
MGLRGSGDPGDLAEIVLVQLRNAEALEVEYCGGAVAVDRR